jgi:hypothetical protein
MNYPPAKASRFPTQSVASLFLTKSYTKAVGLYGRSDRYLVIKPKNYIDQINQTWLSSDTSIIKNKYT